MSGAAAVADRGMTAATTCTQAVFAASHFDRLDASKGSHPEPEDGRTFTQKPGMSYQTADNAEPHRSCTERGATLFIVD